VLLALARNALQNGTLRSPQLQSLQERLRLLYDSRYTMWGLLLIGVLRAIVFLIAYPPAHGADSSDYFLYASQFEGLDAPVVFQLIYPLYPLLIYITHYVLGSVYILILFQVVLSAVQGALFYWGLRRYSPALGFVVALMVLGDAQTGILYNFISTEPLYMFLLNLAFVVFLIQAHRSSTRRLQAGDVALGVLLAATLLARPVGRYLIVPFGSLFLLQTRSVWRTGTVGIAYGVMLAVSVLFNQVVFDSLELSGGGSFMLNRPLLRSGLLEADNGPASAQLLAMRAACGSEEKWNRCMMLQSDGDWPAVRKLYNQAYQEMLETHRRDFAKLVFEAFTDFLRQPGQQYRGPVTPSEVQCADIEETTERNTQAYIENDWLLMNASEVNADRLRPIIQDINESMCPPWPDNATVRQVVDQVALRYRSLSRPHPYLWYGALGILVLVVPWARRFAVAVLLAGAILANHAAASALVLNVQPRYIAVVNPYKGFLILTLLFIVGWLVVRLVDEWLVRSSPPEQAE
jgi:hypothetical protein